MCQLDTKQFQYAESNKTTTSQVQHAHTHTHVLNECDRDGEKPFRFHKIQIKIIISIIIY